jgi:hypothetical protein
LSADSTPQSAVTFLDTLAKGRPVIMVNWASWAKPANHNRSRPHQGINQKVPDLPENQASRLQRLEETRVFSKSILEGLHHEYFRAAA